MRKSIKKVAATLLAATMALGTMTSAFAYTAEEGIIKDVEEDEYIYLLAGNATEWKTNLESAILKPVEGKEGVFSFEFTSPKKTTEVVEDGEYAGEYDTNEWARRFSIIGNYADEENYVVGSWSRMLIGEPNYKADPAYTCLSTICLDDLEEDTDVTLYYDARTATVYLEDKDGNAIDYTLIWLSNDRDDGKESENYSLNKDEDGNITGKTMVRSGYTLDELAETTFDEYVSGLSNDRQNDINNIAENITLTKSLFDGTYVSNVKGLAAYVNGGDDYYKASEPASKPASEPASEPATEATTTAAVVTPAAAKTAAATTAANQATKTGDVAPVALLAVLLASVAVVAVAAKKKEA